MGIQKNYSEIDLSTNSTFSIVLEAEYSVVYVKGTAAGNVSIGIDSNSVPSKGMDVRFIFNGDMAGNTLSIFGTNVTAISTAIATEYNVFYNGSTWIHLYKPSTNTAYINDSQIASNAEITLSKLEAKPASRAVMTNASGIMTESVATTADLAKLNAISVSASDINRVGLTTASTDDLDVMTGADSFGLTPTIMSYLAGLIGDVQAQLNSKASASSISGLVNIRTFDVTISPADVLQLGATPFTLVQSQGGNTIIVPIQIVGQLLFNTTPYATNNEIDVYNGGDNQIWTFPTSNAFLFSTTSKTINAVPHPITAETATQYVAGSPLTLFMIGGNPTGGDSPIRITGLYYVINV